MGRLQRGGDYFCSTKFPANWCHSVKVIANDTTYRWTRVPFVGCIYLWSVETIIDGGVLHTVPALCITFVQDRTQAAWYCLGGALSAVQAQCNYLGV